MVGAVPSTVAPMLDDRLSLVKADSPRLNIGDRAIDGSALEQRVDQPLLDVVGDDLGTDLDSLLAVVADPPAHARIDVVAASDDEQQRVVGFPVAVAQARQGS